MATMSFPVHTRDKKHLESFLEALQKTGKSRHTLVNYRCDLNHFLEHVGVSIGYISAVHIKEYFDSLDGLSLSSRARKQASIRSFFAWCVRNDLLESNPVDKIDRIKAPDIPPQLLDNSTVEKILSAIPAHCLRDKLLFTLIRETGLRVSEALNIYVEDLDLVPEDEKVAIRDEMGSFNRMVMLYAAPQTLKLIKQFLKKSDITAGPLFKGSEAKGGGKHPMHYRSVHYLWTKYCKASGQTASIHALRHTFAAELLNEGVNVTVVKTLLGHKNLQTTMRYVEVTEDFVKAELMKTFQRK